MEDHGRDITVTITRPANTTAYGAGDAVGIADAGTPANAGSAVLEFANCPALAVIEAASLRIDLSAVPASMDKFRLHLYSGPPAARLDNAAWDLPAGDRSLYLGYLEFATPADLGSTLWSFLDGANAFKRVAATDGKLYGELATTGGYTPSSGEVLAVTLRVKRIRSLA